MVKRGSRYRQPYQKKEDINHWLDYFMDNMLNRGHQHPTLLPLFEKAILNATNYLSRGEEWKITAKEEKALAAKRRAYLHVPYHPNNPSAHVIQHHWKQCVAEPPGMLPLNEMENLAGAKVPVDKLIIAYHRAPNLGNLLSYRKIANRTGPEVSSFL